MTWKNGKFLHLCVLFYVSLSFYEPYWRLMVRGLFEGDEFSWSYFGLAGRGTSGGFGVIVFLVLMGIGMLYLGWRKANKLFRVLAFVWVSMLTASSVLLVLSDPGAELVAETIGISVPYGLLILPFDLLFFVLTTVWLISSRGRAAPQPGRAGWTRKNFMYLCFVIALFPLEYVCLNSGAQHDAFDKLGVGLTFIQWILINASLYPWNSSRGEA